ncbi:MAG TPA: glycoside hydrolase family 30 protein [Puia sp.]|nr:glycoside hydrolase family 30 protein [Puia sp.]
MRKLFSAIVFLSFFACNQPTDKADSTTSAGSKNSFSVKEKKPIVYTTADSTNLRLSITDTLSFKDLPQPLETDVCVFVDPTKSFQTLLGIGGALTDASAETFAKLPKEKQQELLAAYYDSQKGIGYTLGRTNIHSCDFSSDTYTYVADNDSSLKSFSIDHDKKFRIPFIKDVIAAAGGKLTLFCSPWSPPAWMKTNNDILHGGKLKPEYYQTWANYYVKFMKAYDAEGIPIWGTTIQNEPMATQKWESCIYSAEDEREFLKKYLGPTLEKEGLGDKKIMVWDHNKDLIYQQASTILSDPDAAKYAWGVAFHWYEDWSGGTQMFENLKRVHESFPDKNLVFSEGCNGPFKMDSIYNWSLGERYGRTMINDFNNGTVGWTDWNILLDETGGPNHVQNFCFAPVHADTKSGKLIYTNAFYYIGHFSKFIKPGSKRVISASSRSPFLTTAFINEDGKLAVVVMNQSDKKIPYKLWIAGKAADVTALPHSIATIVL